MAALPEPIVKAWEQRADHPVFTTVDADGNPNTIYIACMSLYDNETILVADNYFCKTRENIQAGSRGALLFITHEGKAYQIKGTIEYCTEGPLYDDMKTWNPEKHPGHAAAALKIESVYSGAEKIV